jgi:choline kinase
MTKPVKAIILAAGQGTRLRPLTDKQPKAMVLLVQKPMLDRQINVLYSLGLHDISVVTGYCAECISDARVKKIFNQNYAAVNMVASLYCARDLFDGSCDIIVAYGDIVYEPRVLRALLQEESEIAVVVSP